MTPEQRQAIVEHIATDTRYKSGGQFLSAKQIKQVLLGREMVDNPEQPGTVPKPLSVQSVMEAVPDEQYQALSFEQRKAVSDAVLANDRTRLALQLLDAHKAQQISDSTKADLEALMAETISDPNWQAQVPGPVLAETLFGLTSIPGLEDIIKEVTSGN